MTKNNRNRKKNGDALSLTRKLLSYNTINPPGQENDCARFLGKLLEDAGFKTGYHAFAKGRTNLLAELEGSTDKLPICLTGHLDTVPLGAGKWHKDPFGGEIDGDKLYGRGSSDMKSGVAAMVLAALVAAGAPKREAGITLIITAGEETGCRGAFFLAESGGMLGNAGAMIVAEPTSNYPLVGHKGALWLEASTTGVTAHGSMPGEGINAIYKAARVVSRLEKFRFDVSPHPLLGPATLNVGTISGGTNINSVPDRTAIGVDIRTIPGQNNSKVLKAIQSYLGDEVDIDLVVDVEGISTDPQHEWIRQVFDIMEKYIGERPEPRGATYFTDGSVLKSALGDPPTTVLGPGEAAMAHKTDEFCFISKINAATEAYAEIIRQWCGI